MVIVYLKNSDPGICSVIEESKLYPIQTNIDTTQRFTGIITFTIYYFNYNYIYNLTIFVNFIGTNPI